MGATTKCLVVDDHPAVRQGLGLMFGDAPDLELVGDVERGEDPLEAIERPRPGGLHTGGVARRIGLSTETVKSDTKRAILKLEADTRVHAVAIALRQAIIE